ncbi:MAG: hypothetical protein IIZ51_08085 [Lachnospiraceae bacterium]|nr:hypothetical protein [Lachnospiraceae bacterium]MBQ1399725.1 hypothetical protein [Lachnospiraceae bacterium]MBQ1515792.1 hypothetical protein [Lachnospiraceae bacterium]
MRKREPSMDRIEKTAKELRVRRVVMTVAGIVICGVSVGMFSFSGMGMDPFQVFAHGLWKHIPLSFGTFYMLLCAALLVVMAFTARKKIGLGTVLNLFLLGYVADLSLRFWHWVLPHPTIAVCVVFLFLGVVIMCLSSALYFTADMGVSTYDFIALTISEKQSRVPFRWCRVATDLICVAAGLALGGSVGIGTVVTAFFMGPLISFFNRFVAEPLLYAGTRNRTEAQREIPRSGAEHAA